jgi:multiple sugar transport system permease protein
VSLVLALLLNMKVKGQAFYRTVFFLPSLMPVVATSMLWAFMYAGDGGIINALLAKLGVTGPTWLADPRFAKPALIIMALWGAGHAMVILLAGLQDVPESLHEAAIIDGAGFLARLFHITLPMLSPVLYFNMVMGTIGGFQVFAQAFIMTDATGAPDRSTLFLVLYLYNTGFSDLRMGYACAMAWVLFMVIAGLTLLLTRAARNWVFYDR